jgi:hypothetical protein
VPVPALFGVFFNFQFTIFILGDMGRLHPASALVMTASELDKNCAACFLHLASLGWSKVGVPAGIRTRGFRTAARRITHLATPLPFSNIFYGGVELVSHLFSYVAHFVIFRDAWIRTQRAAVASRRATHLSANTLSASVWGNRRPCGSVT